MFLSNKLNLFWTRILFLKEFHYVECCGHLLPKIIVAKHVVMRMNVVAPEKPKTLKPTQCD